MSFEADSVIPNSHPSLEGHFPGNPIVPGVVVLDEVINAALAWKPEAQVGGFAAVKFLTPLLPDEPFSIQFTEMGSRRAKFNCYKKSNSESAFATGQLKLDHPEV
ncbi:MAG: hypothetical protein OEZ68_05950 [Gammaproteobacteria bacterium]|nr:hypothetical protein [Gammaproteobacteria bacterium]MDH5800331.1 hypothetical protein [Gammaproteobacteria bacterium]